MGGRGYVGMPLSSLVFSVPARSRRLAGPLGGFTTPSVQPFRNNAKRTRKTFLRLAPPRPPLFPPVAVGGHRALMAAGASARGRTAVTRKAMWCLSLYVLPRGTVLSSCQDVSYQANPCRKPALTSTLKVVDTVPTVAYLDRQRGWSCPHHRNISKRNEIQQV